MAQHEVVEIRDLKCSVEQAQLSGQLGEEKRMMIGRLASPVTTHECPNGQIFCGFNLIRRQEAEAVLVPSFRRAKVTDLQNGMADPENMGWTGLEADSGTKPLLVRGCVSHPVRDSGRRLAVGLSRHNFNAITVGICQSDNHAATGLVQTLHNDTFCRSERLQISQSFGPKANCQEFRIPGLCDMQKWSSVAALAIELPTLLEAFQAKVFQECAHDREIWRRKTDMRDILDLDDGHSSALSRFDFDYLVK